MALTGRVSSAASICLRCQSRIWRQPVPPLAPEASHFLRNSSRRRPSTLYLHQRHASSTSAASSLLGGQDAPKTIPNDRNPETPAAPSASYSKVNTLIDQAQQAGEHILATSQQPPEDVIIQALKSIELAAQSLTGDASSLPDLPESQISQAEALLEIHDSAPAPLPKSLSSRAEVLSRLAHRLMIHPPVFITPELLAVYTNIQRLLRRPFSFPEIFHLYAAKPAPKPGTAPPEYTPQDPRAASAAVPQEVAVAALNAALPTKNLDLALDIIETTAAAAGHRRAKLVKKALPPALALGAFPSVLFMGASQFAMSQTLIPSSTAMTVLFGGMLTYFGATGTLAYVTITTVNDHMVRVTWAQGVPLWERWVREEERAAVDRIVCAWGFKEQDRWGEEEGAMWEELKDWAGSRGMIVDKTELMAGME